MVVAEEDTPADTLQAVVFEVVAANVVAGNASKAAAHAIAVCHRLYEAMPAPP